MRAERPVTPRARLTAGLLRRPRAPRRAAGFSLIELAVVLVIIGLLVGGSIAAFVAGTEQTRRAQQRRQFEVVRAALYGFAMSHGRLPCPDTSYPPDGEADDDGGSPLECSGQSGALPWVDLGVGSHDAWGQPLRYRVTTDPAQNAEAGDFADGVGAGDPASFAIGDEGDLSIYRSAALTDDVAASVVAVVVSYGKEGERVWAAGGFTCPAAGSAGFSDDEHENCNESEGLAEADRFVDAAYRPEDVDDGFDDMLAWIPYPVLTARMVEAGKLP